MNDNIQNINEIAPMQDQEAADQTKKDYEQGKRFLANGDLGQAAVSLHNALVAYEETKNKNGIANASNQLGEVCLEKGDFEAAQKHYQKAWDICTELGDPLSLFALSKKMIEVYRGLGEYPKAIEYCFDVLDGYQANNNPQGSVAVLEQIAEIYEADKQPEKAADTYKTIASIHRNFKHDSIANSFEEKAAKLTK